MRLLLLRDVVMQGFWKLEFMLSRDVTHAVSLVPEFKCRVDKTSTIPGNTC